MADSTASQLPNLSLVAKTPTDPAISAAPHSEALQPAGAMSQPIAGMVQPVQAEDPLPPIPSQPAVTQPTSAPLPASEPSALPPATPQPASGSVKGMTSVVDALFSKGLIDDAQLKSVKLESITNNKPQIQILVEKDIVTEQQIIEIKAEMYGLPYVDLRSVALDRNLLNKLNKDTAGKNQAIVFEETTGGFKVAMADPLDLQKVKYLESLLGKKVDAHYAAPSAIKEIVDTKYGAQITEEVSQALEDVGVVDIGRTGAAIEDLAASGIDSAPVAKIVNTVLDYAIKHKASDVHIEPREDKVSVRYRVQGILSEKLTIPIRLSPSVVSRIKILSNLKIDEHRVPQDGRFQVKSGEKVVDIRVSIMPSVYGEKVVLRLLEKDNGMINVEDTGMRGPALKIYREALAKTQGIILVTGPTGSGKTVTLASSLAKLNTQDVNIVTVEDPVEIRINGITQVQANPEVGLTFAAALRSFLRQDPDIIMVGEVRDTETAELAVQAALTGHLVLATLHTNSAAGALPRLLDMGVQPFLLSSTINVIAAQRLVRKLCDDCKQEYEATPEIVDMLHKHLDGLRGFDLYKEEKGEKIHFDSETKTVKLYKAVGCPKCGDSGYDGRMGIFEVMAMTDKIGQMVMSHLSANEIKKEAVTNGMITMLQDGLMKSIEGATTVEEVLRVQSV